MGASMPLQNKRTIVILATIAIFLTALFCAAFLLLSQRSEDSKREYQDPFSGEVVSDPPGKTPDKFGTSADLPLFLGFDDLIEHGLSEEQLYGLKTAFYNYSKTLSRPASEISIDVNNITDTKEERGGNQFFVSTFPVKFNRKDLYKARLEYTGLNDIRLYLYDNQAGRLLYDSKTIGETG
jgi:hypothetical protein